MPQAAADHECDPPFINMFCILFPNSIVHLFLRRQRDQYIISGHAATCHCSPAAAGHWQWSKQYMPTGWCSMQSEMSQWQISQIGWPMCTRYQTASLFTQHYTPSFLPAGLHQGFGFILPLRWSTKKLWYIIQNAVINHNMIWQVWEKITHRWSKYHVTKAAHCVLNNLCSCVVSVNSFQSGLSLQPTWGHDVITEVPVLLKSAHSFNLFLILLSECEGNAFLISSILILRGRSRLFQNRRYMNTCIGHRALQQFHVHAIDLLWGIRNNTCTTGVCFLERANPKAKASRPAVMPTQPPN
jgi:hypothetical protein